MQDPFGSLDNSSPLLLQFSSLSDPVVLCWGSGIKGSVFECLKWSLVPIVPEEVGQNTWLFMSLLSCQCLQRPGIYCQFLVVVHVIDVLIGYWVSYPSNGLKRGKSPGRIHESLHLSKKVHCTKLYCLLKARVLSIIQVWMISSMLIKAATYCRESVCACRKRLRWSLALRKGKNSSREWVGRVKR
jgi:hypothetical protein